MIRSLTLSILIPGLPVLGEAILAVYRPVLAGLERHFTFFFTVRTNRLVHLSWASEAPSAPKSTVSHNKFSVRAFIPATSIRPV
jgi:hypothetical protein